MSLTLQDIFDDLKNGELSQFSYSGDLDAPAQGIDKADYPILISHINKALTALHTRLVLKEREVTVELMDEVSFYILDRKYALSNVESTEPKWIIDTDERPFINDVLKVRSAYTNYGYKVPINDDTATSGGLWFNNYKTFQCSYPSDDTTLFLQYQANHPRLVWQDIDNPEDVEIDIPEYCEEALLAYVTYRVYHNSADVAQHQLAQSFRMKYDTLCQEIERYNLSGNDPNNTNTKLEQKGYI